MRQKQIVKSDSTDSELLKEFFEFLSSKVAFSTRKIVAEAIKSLKEHFRANNLELDGNLEEHISSMFEINYSSRIVELIEVFSDGQAKDVEAQIE